MRRSVMLCQRIDERREIADNENFPIIRSVAGVLGYWPHLVGLCVALH